MWKKRVGNKKKMVLNSKGNNKSLRFTFKNNLELKNKIKNLNKFISLINYKIRSKEIYICYPYSNEIVLFIKELMRLGCISNFLINNKGFIQVSLSFDRSGMSVIKKIEVVSKSFQIFSFAKAIYRLKFLNSGHYCNFFYLGVVDGSFYSGDFLFNRIKNVRSRSVKEFKSFLCCKVFF